MQDNLRLQLENYIEDWHSDIETNKSALNIGKFMFSFMNFLDNEKIVKTTKLRYEENVYLIGMFETQYGYNNDFDREDLKCSESYEDEFKRKIVYSKTDLKFYKATWNKIIEYVSSGSYRKYLDEIEEEYIYLGCINDIIDFIQRINYAKIKDSKIKKKIKDSTQVIKDNYVEFEDCETKEEYNNFILKSWKETELVCELINSSELEKSVKNEILKKGKELKSGFYELVNN